MTATVNEEWTWNVTTREAGAVEAGVRIYTWDVTETNDVDQTTDAQGVIPEQQVRENSYADSGMGFGTTGLNPYRIRALKYGLNMFGVDQNFVGPTVNTFFLSQNANITEATKATVDAYTGITYNHTTDTVTVDGTGITPVNTIDRLYDHTQTEAVDVPQYDFLEIMSTNDKQNYTFEYDWVIDGFDMTYQSRAISMGTGKTVTWQGSITGPISSVTITGNAALTAQTDMSGVTINGDLSINFGAANVTLSFTNTTVTGDITNDGTGTLTINASGGSLSTTEPGTGPGQVNIVTSVPITVTAIDQATGLPVENAAVYIETTTAVEVLNTVTNASGVASGTYGGTTPATVDDNVSGVKSGSGSKPYVYFTLGGTIESGTGYSATALLTED